LEKVNSDSFFLLFLYKKILEKDKTFFSLYFEDSLTLLSADDMILTLAVSVNYLTILRRTP